MGKGRVRGYWANWLVVGVQAMLVQVFWSGWSSPRDEGEALERFSAVERCFGDGLLIHSMVMPSLLRVPFPIDVVFILFGMTELLRCCWRKVRTVSQVLLRALCFRKWRQRSIFSERFRTRVSCAWHCDGRLGSFHNDN